jgi:aspartate racemase
MIGIIGGAGVAATNKLLELIEIDITKSGAIRDCHHPEVLVYYATQAPSRSMFLEGRGESYIPAYIDAANKLKHAGATILCMNCNTAHYAIDDISKNADMPFINLIEQVCLKVKELEIEKIGLVASDGCLFGKVYEKYISIICPDTKIIYPDESLQKSVTKGICNIKNSNRFMNEKHPERPRNIFADVKSELLSAGADKVIVGCTDIRVDYFDQDNIDSTEILKESIIKHSR